MTQTVRLAMNCRLSARRARAALLYLRDLTDRFPLTPRLSVRETESLTQSHPWARTPRDDTQLSTWCAGTYVHPIKAVKYRMFCFIHPKSLRLSELSSRTELLISDRELSALRQSAVRQGEPRIPHSSSASSQG